jgi:outer membrane protein assembly factor BamE (lipoprotein component of BamABCDE complex)
VFSGLGFRRDVGIRVLWRISRDGFEGCAELFNSGVVFTKYIKGRRRISMSRLLFSAAAVLVVSGCMSAAKHRKSVQDNSGDRMTVGTVQDNSGDRMTVGTVQKEIRVGMSGAEVAQVLGSPNIVSTDKERREVWMYDKISTETAYSTSKGGIAALILVSRITDVILGGSGGTSASSGASSTSQRTLTVIIKFDDDKMVRDFAYHASRF